MSTTLLDKLLRSAAAIALFTAPAMAQSETASDLAEEEVAESETSELDDDLFVLETINVTGTSLRGVKPTGADMITVDRTTIDAIGVTTTSNLLAQIPQITNFNQLPTGLSSLGSVTDVPNLRGIGLGGTSTLTILNGRRLVGAGVLQTIPEPSAIPPLALQRVEVLADGASAIYGSDPIAGVINLITRTNFDGFETTGRIGFADSYTEWNAGAVFGKTWDTGNFMVAYDYNGHDAINGADRDFITNDRSAFGDPDERSTSCPDANIAAGGFEIFPGFFAGEVTFAGPDFQPNTLNRCDVTDWQDIYGKEQRHSVFASARQALGDTIELYTEGYYSERNTKFRQPQEALNFTMPITNPYFFDPTGTGQTSVRVQYRFNDEFGDSVIDETNLWASGLVVGTIFDVGNDWAVDAYANFGWGNTVVTEPGINQVAAFTAGVFGFTPETALDPFGGNTSAAVLDAIGDYVSLSQSDQAIRAFQIKADGPLVSLAGGDVRLAVGARNHREEVDASLANGPTGAPTFMSEGEVDRSINSIFAEFYIPIFGEDNAKPGFQELNLSLAARYDHYSDVGGTTNPKVGVNWEPVTGLKLRGSWGTAFHAPKLTDVAEPTVDARVQVVPALPSFLTPPGQGDLSAIVIAGGNPDLTPEEATTYTFGFDIEPESISGLTISGTYYDIAFENGISLPVDGTGRVYSIPALAQYFTLNPTAEEVQFWTDRLPVDGFIIPPVELILDARRHNLQRVNQTGLEFQARYITSALDGELIFSASGNKILKSELQVAPGEDFVSNKDSMITFRGRGSALWFKDQVRLGAVVRYTGSSNNTTVEPMEKIDSFTTVDLNIGYTIEELSFLEGFELSLNIDNVFDAKPPYFNGGSGITNGNPLGRKVSIGLRKVW